MNGNGKVVDGLKVTGSDNVGLFSKIGLNGCVKNLVIQNAEVSGEGKFAGALAGVVEGKVKNVAVKNASVSSSADGSMIGGLAGKISGEVETSYVEGGKVFSNVTENQSVVLGGFAGKLDSGKISACYVNNTIVKENKNKA